MSNQEDFQHSTRFNLALWLSVALFILGIVEIIGVIEFLPEFLKSQFTGPIFIALGILLFLYPLREIKKAIALHKQSDDE